MNAVASHHETVIERTVRAIRPPSLPGEADGHHAQLFALRERGQQVFGIAARRHADQAIAARTCATSCRTKMC